MGLADDELRAIEQRWSSTDEVAAWAESLGGMSANEVVSRAVEDIDLLLAEVRRLQAELREVHEGGA